MWQWVHDDGLIRRRHAGGRFCLLHVWWHRECLLPSLRLHFRSDRIEQIPTGCLKWSLMAVLTSVMPSQHGGILPKVPIFLEQVNVESTDLPSRPIVPRFAGNSYVLPIWGQIFDSQILFITQSMYYGCRFIDLLSNSKNFARFVMQIKHSMRGENKRSLRIQIKKIDSVS